MLCSSYVEMPWNLREMIKIYALYALYACLFDKDRGRIVGLISLRGLNEFLVIILL
jgi:hypothetical protein